MGMPETEVAKLRADLQEFGCPYAMHDPHARAWLAGYMAGQKAAYARTEQIAKKVFGETPHA